MTGDAIAAGATGDGCSRCTGASIASHLDTIEEFLDVDGDLEATALTDGLLVVRYLFGLRGQPLISSAVGSGCTRCSAAAIEAYLDGLF